MKKIITFIAPIVILSACGGARDEFAKTDSGRALMTCVAGGGSIDIQSIDLGNQQKGVNVKLLKNNKNIEMQFAVDGKINQASLVGATIVGEKKLTRFSLMLNLELVCGGELASKILPDDYRNLQMLNQMQRIFR
jgi:hypothetical protein